MLNEEANRASDTFIDGLIVGRLRNCIVTYLHSEGEGEADAGQADQGQPIEECRIYRHVRGTALVVL